MNVVDQLTHRIAAAIIAHRIPSASVWLLRDVRREAARRVRERLRSEGLELAARADAGDVDAPSAYGDLAERAIAEMNAEVASLARARGLPEKIAAYLHRRFSDTDATEYLDDPNLDEAMRVRLLTHLDAVNTVAGSYRMFLEQMRPYLRDDRPTRILDLAAGHGGFAIEATRLAKTDGLRVHFTATDLKPEYLAIGQAIARREGLDVAFQPQDALDLSNLEPGAFDVIVCTQSIHHFGPAMTARMFREAARVAGTAVVFVDGCRSVTHGTLFPSFFGLRYRDPAFAHDAFVSFRRFFVPEELSLIASLGPEAGGVEARWIPPTHCVLRFERLSGGRRAGSS